jgi:dihydroorotate dehydrogenase
MLAWCYRRVLRPVLFAQDAEAIHDRTLAGLGWVSRHRAVCRLLGSLGRAPGLPVERFGLRFPNPVGLAAGMDKRGEALPAWEALGFGHVELGAVTALAQTGNSLPRVFRAVPEESIVNRMGFNNPGAAAAAQTLRAWRESGGWPRHPVGMNLGKSKVTPLDQAAADYRESFRLLRSHVDFVVVNVSSPNTPNLRKLQDKAALDEILAALQEENGESGAGPGTKPVLVKVAPDLSFAALDEILELVEPRRVAGLVATNTTLSRPVSADPRVRRVYAEAGGLSGRPLRTRSTELIRHLYRQSRGRVPLVGVGGIFSAADAWEKALAGACLLQVYTGLVYEGPFLARRIVHGLKARMAAEGIQSWDEVVGKGT